MKQLDIEIAKDPKNKDKHYNQAAVDLGLYSNRFDGKLENLSCLFSLIHVLARHRSEQRLLPGAFGFSGSIFRWRVGPGYV